MSDKSKDTGTGGINIDGKVHTMDVGVPDAQVDNTKAWSSGDISVDQTVKDLSKPTLETLAKYLSKTTLGQVGAAPRKNVYPVGSGDATSQVETSLKDADSLPVSPGPQDNDAKFDNSFNSTIASNNPAGIRRGLAPGSGPDGNVLLSNAAEAAPQGEDHVKFVSDGLRTPIKDYTDRVVIPNLFDFNSGVVRIADGTLNLPAGGIRSIKVISQVASPGTDGGTSKNILSEDGPEDYTLTQQKAASLAGEITQQNFFPVESSSEFVKPWDVDNNPISVTAAQNNFKNANFFTRIPTIGEGEDQHQVVSAIQISTYTDAYQNAVKEGFEVKRGRTAASDTAIGGNKLLAQIAIPSDEVTKEKVNYTRLTDSAEFYYRSVVGGNIHNWGSARVDIPKDGFPAGIRSLYITKDLETNAGTSKGLEKLNFAQAADVIKDKTSDNDYSVDSPSKGSGSSISIVPVKLSSSDKLALTNNSQYFFDLRIGSNPVISKGKLRNGDAPDGNQLLVNSLTKDGLKEPLKTYTSETVKLNLFNFDSSLVSLSDGTLNQSPEGIRNFRIIPRDASVTTDGGESKNILGPDEKGNYTLTILDSTALAEQYTATNFFRVSPTSIYVKPWDLNNNPISVTAAQDNSSQIDFFTKDKVVEGSTITVAKLRSSYTSALTKAEIAEPYTFIIKRGKTEKQNGIDGNNLLPTIAPEENSIAILTPRAETYFTKVLEPNLNKFYNSKLEPDNNPGVKVPAYVEEGSPSGIKVLNKTTNFASDAGSSENVLGGKRQFTVFDAISTVNLKTAINFFPVVVPDVSQEEIFSNIGSSQVLIHTKNPYSFSNIEIGSNVIVSSKGNLKNTDPDGKLLPDGNELLKDSLVEPTNRQERIVFVKTLDGGKLGLIDPIKSYTLNKFNNNLYSPIENEAIKNIDDLKNINFFGPGAIRKPLTGPADSGTFNYLKVDSQDRRLGRDEVTDYFQQEILGRHNVPGGLKNQYTPSFDGISLHPSNVVGINDSDGYPSSPTDAQGSDQNINTEFIDGSKVPTSYSDNYELVKIKRGKSKKGDVNGDALLRDAVVQPVTGQAQFIKTTRAISPNLLNYTNATLEANRYSPLSDANYFVAPNGVLQGATGDQVFQNITDNVPVGSREGSFVHKTKLYAPSELKFGESPQSMANRGEPASGFTFRRLTRIGTILQLRAAGEITFLTDEGADPRSEVQKLAALVPGAGQAGAGIPLSRELLNVEEIIKNLPDDVLSGDLNSAAKYEGELIDFNSSFEGTVNSTLEKFSGFTSIGLIALAIALVGVITFSLELLASAGGPDKEDSMYGRPINDKYGFLALGAFQQPRKVGTNIVDQISNAAIGGGWSWSTLFGINKTYNRKYDDAVYRGALSFFGIDSDPPKLLSIPGQVIVTARSIVRSVSQLVLAFIEIGTAFASGNITNAIFLIAEIIDKVRNSRIVSALNTFSGMGDKIPVGRLNDDLYQLVANAKSSDEATVLGGEKSIFQVNSTRGSKDIGIKISEIDSVDSSAKKHKFIDEEGLVTEEGIKKGGNSEYVGISQVKNRLLNSRALAWSSYRSPSLLIDPTVNLKQTITDNITGEPVGSGILKAENAVRLTDDGIRISNDLVDSIETTLDGEYMPFYFHDLRTNEILSFHAFLVSLSDDFSVNYESSTGIGRIEPIRTYKDTQRKIGLSFILAALGEADFDYMWEKINKLTTLAYPQFSRGKEYYNPATGIRFEQPFTQQVVAPPMVRLRLGNLFRSNYSRFNLARLFGLDRTDVVLAKSAEVKNKEAFLKKLVEYETKKAEVEKELNVAWFGVIDNKFDKDYTYKLTKVTVYQVSDDPNPKLAVPSPPKLTDGKPAASSAHERMGNKSSNVYKTIEGDKDTGLRFKIDSLVDGDQEGDPTYAKGSFIWVGDLPNGKKPEDIESTQNKLFKVPLDDLEADEDTIKKIEGAFRNRLNEELTKQNIIMPEQATGGIDDPENEFMNPDSNAIVRSFESTMGKGLAGFIDSVGFDWYDRVTWDIGLDRKAPKMCKITISFTPVHDIAPGLDSEGRNRAPIYPLGPFGFGTRSSPR